MISEDETILSAYLDGQLGPEEQHALEAALLENPRLAEELRGLAAVRELLAGLPREAPADLSSRVVRRIRRRALLGSARGVIARGPARAAAIAAIAAGLLAAIVAPWMTVGRRDPGPAKVLAGPRKPPPGPSDPRWPTFSHPDRGHAPGPVVGAPAGPPRDKPEGAPDPVRDELAHVREYLDHPQLRQIFLVSDPGDGSGERRVADVVEQTTRFNFYKITISQGIVLDPLHPDRATVFALVVGPRELRSLRSRLREALDDRVEERPTEPRLMPRLADIDRVEACSPSPAAEMRIPREALAYRDEDPNAPAGPPPEPTRPPAPGPHDGPTHEQEYSSPAAELVDRSIVVLVWVSRGRPG